MDKISRKYTYLAKTDSVNNRIKEKIYSSAAPVYDVIYAGEQTSGRGRSGRSFFSPEGGLYFSAAYPLKGTEKNIPFFTLAAGLAVKRAIQELSGVKTEIKWPNDIYLNGKKLCGILTELVFPPCGMHAAAGIGINTDIKKEEIPPELSEKMTSFAAQGLTAPDKTALMRRIVSQLDGMIYSDGILNSVPDKIISELNACSFLSGKEVISRGENGIFKEIAPDGSARVLFSNREERVFTGEIVCKT